MSSFNYGDRLKFLEDKVDVITREMNQMLNQLSQTVINIVDTHRLFTQYVTTRLEELSNGKGATVSEREEEAGKEI